MAASVSEALFKTRFSGIGFFGKCFHSSKGTQNAAGRFLEIKQTKNLLEVSAKVDAGNFNRKSDVLHLRHSNEVPLRPGAFTEISTGVFLVWGDTRCPLSRDGKGAGYPGFFVVSWDDEGEHASPMTQGERKK